MTIKDYVMLAERITLARLDNANKDQLFSRAADVDDGLNLAALSIAHGLAADNPRFDRARFLKACGVSQ